MDNETIAALKRSIAHWRDNEEGAMTEVSFSSDDCALCALPENAFCEGCPVYHETGEVNCGGSPYMEAVDAYERWHRQKTEDNEAAYRTAARKERAFLISLLPASEKE